MPELPENLTSLLCHDNKLKKLPPLPQSIQYVFCYINNLTEYPIIFNINNLKNFDSGLNPIDIEYINLYFPESIFGEHRFIEYLNLKLKHIKNSLKNRRMVLRNSIFSYLRFLSQKTIRRIK